MPIPILLTTSNITMKVWGIDTEENVNIVLTHHKQSPNCLLQNCYIDGIEICNMEEKHIPDGVKNATHFIVNIGMTKGFFKLFSIS